MIENVILKRSKLIDFDVFHLFLQYGGRFSVARERRTRII